MRFANRTGMRVAIATAATGALAAGAFAVMTSASASPNHAAGSHGVMGVHTVGGPTAYSFRTVDNAADLTFNQLLGINNSGVIAGYFGSGAQGHPNMGYLLTPGGYRGENFPGSVQTQVTGLNDNGVTVGFWSGMNTANMTNNNFGFYSINGQGFHNVNFPTTNNANPPVNQLLGVNDHNTAVGSYTDAKGTNHGYLYSIGGGSFTRVTEPGHPGASLTAAAINNHGDVAGFYTNPKGVTDGFLASPLH
jgi:hypothetical protein